ncbi:MAG TPA: hypothetical protein VE988_07420 [Gemmataceae bacterium]|nr:hypothetical protein [Gemmataceae bacterium]
MSVFKTDKENTQPLTTPIVAETAQTDLAFCLALLAKKSGDLALVVDRWETLPTPIKAAVMALVRSASGGSEPA